MTPNKLARPLVLLGGVLVLTGCTIVGDRYAPAGDTSGQDLSTVVGNVHVDDGATINEASTVAGDIRIDNDSTTGDLNSAAGNITVGERVRVQGSINSAAGNIRVDAGSHIEGGIHNAAGNIILTGCQIDGRVESTRGDITLDRTNLAGGLLVKKTRSLRRDWVNLTIGPGSTVATVEVVDDHKVSLRISREAEVGRITGITPEYF